MKRIVCVGVLALFALLVMASFPANADVWKTDRYDISVSSGTVDFIESASDSGDTSYDVTVELPCQYNELIGMTDPVITVNSTNAVGLTYSIVVNGDTVVNNAIIAGVGTHTRTAQFLADQLTDNTTDELVFNITCNVSTNEIWLYFEGDDVPISTARLAGAIVVKEKDVGTPTVNEVWTVNNSVNVTNALNYTLTDILINLTYPMHAQVEPIANISIATLASSATDTTYVQYQKTGPYFDEEDDIEGTTITVYSYEGLQDVYWEFVPTDYDVFAKLDVTDILTIKQSKDTLDQGEWDDDPEDWYWDEDSEKIIFEQLNIQEDEEDNEFSFTWTTTGGLAGPDEEAIPEEIPPVEEPFYMQNVVGIPVWLVIGIIAVVIIVVIVASKK